MHGDIGLYACGCLTFGLDLIYVSLPFSPYSNISSIVNTSRTSSIRICISIESCFGAYTIILLGQCSNFAKTRLIGNIAVGVSTNH